MALIAISLFTAVLTFCYVLVVLFFRKGWQRLAYFSGSNYVPSTRVSILIAARNEEERIESTIKDILGQNYPAHLMELIVVDDHSTDRTAEIVQSYESKGVRLIKLNEDQPLNSYKKKAISEAINLSTGELIITTDADCRMGSRWISTVVDYYQEYRPKLISSPVVYFEEKNHFERLQTLEFLYLIGLGASTIGNKVPSTCNGANLAYEKSVFIELNGFKGIDDLASGDDELFLHKVASRYRVGIGFCKSRDAIVYTHAKPDLRAFIQQRRRWASKSTRYKNKGIIALGVTIWLFNVFIFLNFLSGFYEHTYWDVCLLALAAKLSVETAFLMPMTEFIKKQKLILYLPLLTVIHVVYMIYIGIAGNSGKYVWKGRMVR